MSTEAMAAAMNRIADALEQLVLSGPADPYPARLGAPDEIADLPPVRQPAATVAVCPVHNVPWKLVPAGVSKRTGNAYDAFLACSIKDCSQRPPR